MKALTFEFFLAETLEEKSAILANLLEKVAEEVGVSSVHYLDAEEVTDANGFKHLRVYFNELQVFEAVY